MFVVDSSCSFLCMRCDLGIFCYLDDVYHGLYVVRILLHSAFDHHQTRAAVLGKLDHQFRVTSLFGELCAVIKIVRA